MITPYRFDPDALEQLVKIELQKRPYEVINQRFGVGKGTLHAEMIAALTRQRKEKA